MKPQLELEFNDIHTYYGEAHILQGASLSIPKGAVVGLLGRNGMGKTTLVRSAVGFSPPRLGEILFRQQPIQKLPPYRIARLGIGLVPQGRRIFRSLRTIENLSLAASGLASQGRSPRANRWSIEDIFNLFPNLRRRQNSQAGTLSGGEAQMLAIGRALMANPELVLMDEPSEGLAPVVIDELKQIIPNLKKRGLTILLVEQHLELATAVSDFIFIMERGQIVFHGTRDEFLERKDIQARHLGV